MDQNHNDHDGHDHGAKTNVCTMCKHEHTKANGTCDCGCSMKMNKPKVCTMCGHEHKVDGTCDCGCKMK